MPSLALIVGVSGVVGRNLAEQLLHRGWRVAGLARRPPSDIEGLQPISVDLLDFDALGGALSSLRPSHVFITTWMRQATERQDILINS